MIVILSIRRNEASTTDVIQWIEALGGDCVRVNAQDLTELSWALNVGASGSPCGFMSTKGVWVDLANVDVVWFRKMSTFPSPDLSAIPSEALQTKVNRHLGSEFDHLQTTLHRLMRKAFWLTEPSIADPNKLEVLIEARACGLQVPETLVTTRKRKLVEFRNRVGELIIKPIGNTSILSHDGAHQLMYTEVLTAAMIEALPEHFFPVLVQRAIEKRYELRVFYLDGVCYPVAILSQGDEKTKLDVRCYNFEKPNRTVPYTLPAEVSRNLATLMKALGHGTGSIDILRGQDGGYYFLEINPVGQFGMVSHAGNYGLERKVAEYLLEREEVA